LVWAVTAALEVTGNIHLEAAEAPEVQVARLFLFLSLQQLQTATQSLEAEAVVVAVGAALFLNLTHMTRVRSQGLVVVVVDVLVTPQIPPAVLVVRFIGPYRYKGRKLPVQQAEQEPYLALAAAA
jgi:hypothetical protein